MIHKDSTFSPRFPQGFEHDLAVALYEPEIPLNVGSVARTCACTGIALHLVGALGFRLDNRLARRAGLDYWEHADVAVHRTWPEFTQVMSGRRMWLFSTKGKKVIWDASFREGDVLVFGSEGAGLPESILDSALGGIVVIPMKPGLRSLNLSNTVAVAVYEALRQLTPRA